jgi:hypothetical protein
MEIRTSWKFRLRCLFAPMIPALNLSSAVSLNHPYNESFQRAFLSYLTITYSYALIICTSLYFPIYKQRGFSFIDSVILGIVSTTLFNFILSIYFTDPKDRIHWWLVFSYME